MLFRQERWPGAVPSDTSFIWGPRRTPPENGSAAKPAPSRLAPAFPEAADFSLLLKFRIPVSTPPPPISVHLSLLSPLPLFPSFPFSSSSFQRKKIRNLHPSHPSSNLMARQTGAGGDNQPGVCRKPWGSISCVSTSLPQHPDFLLSGSAILDMADSRP